MKKVAVIGAGISGLFIANLFKKNSNYQITVYEKNTLISFEEGYGVQTQRMRHHQPVWVAVQPFDLLL